MYIDNIIMTSLGGGIQGISPRQTNTNYKNSEQIMSRTILRKSWNTPYATGSVNNIKSKITPFRAINNLGDFLSRQYYCSGGPSQVQANKPGYKSIIGSMNVQNDGTNIPSSTCNVKYVSDSSDYVKFKKLRAINQTYNDNKFGGYNK